MLLVITRGAAAAADWVAGCLADALHLSLGGRNLLRIHPADRARPFALLDLDAASGACFQVAYDGPARADDAALVLCADVNNLVEPARDALPEDGPTRAVVHAYGVDVSLAPRDGVGSAEHE